MYKEFIVHSSHKNNRFPTTYHDDNIYKEFFVCQNNDNDIYMYHCGEQICNPNHRFGPGVRDHYLIHYILKGKGSFTINNKTYTLKAGDGFLITPNTLCSYEASGADPWHYVWVGFDGINSDKILSQASLSISNPVFSYTKDSALKNLFEQMLSSTELTPHSMLKLTGLLYIFFSILVESSSEAGIQHLGDSKSFYIKKAVFYVKTNYTRRLTVEETAKYIGIDRSYFTKIFTRELKMSPQEYIISFKINKACCLIRESDLTISEVARSVGYDDALAFSKIFKKIIGCSPKSYKNMNLISAES